jgi:large subunit ribosomal protein L21
MSYAIISLGGKQYRVREGEKLVVDRIAEAEGKTLTPRVLFVGGDGKAELAPENVAVTARVVEHVLGKKIRIGKYKPKKGYRRHTGFRSRLTQIEIEAIGTAAAGRARAAKAKADAAPPAEEKPEAAAKPEAKAEKAEAPVQAPTDYEGLKVAEVADWTKGRRLPTLEAALAWEQGHAARKGAIAALEAAIAKRKEGGS